MHSSMGTHHQQDSSLHLGSPLYSRTRDTSDHPGYQHVTFLLQSYRSSASRSADPSMRGGYSHNEIIEQILVALFPPSPSLRKPILILNSRIPSIVFQAIIFMMNIVIYFKNRDFNKFLLRSPTRSSILDVFVSLGCVSSGIALGRDLIDIHGRALWSNASGPKVSFCGMLWSSKRHNNRLS